MNILAISGSLRADSSNGLILRSLQAMAGPDVQFTLDDHIGQLPHFLPGDNIPAIVTRFLAAVAAADAVIICTPEYAHGIPGVLKNALDWTVAAGSFYERPVALITASSQGAHGHAALLEVLEVLTARIIPGASLLIPFIRAKIGADGRIEAGVMNDLEALWEAVIRYLQP